MGASGLMVENRTQNFYVTSSNLAQVICQAALHKLLTYCVPRPTQPPTVSGTGNVVAYGLWDEGLVWLIGAVVYLLCCTAAPFVRCRGYWHNVPQHH